MNENPFAVRDGASGGQGYDERLIAIHAMRADGLTLQAIGDTFGVTRERIRQLLVISNGPTAEQVRDFRRRRAAEQVHDRQAELIGWLHANPGGRLQQARDSLGWTDAELASAVTPEAHRLAVRAKDGDAYRQFSNDQIFRALRTAWSQRMDGSSGLSAKRYQELLATGLIVGPSAVRVIQVFGSWSRALDLAGVPTGRVPNRDYASHWTDGDILAAVGRYLHDPGTNGSYAGWDEWRRVEAPSAPSGGLIRNRLGKWSQVKALALAAAAGERSGPGHGRPRVTTR